MPPQFLNRVLCDVETNSLAMVDEAAAQGMYVDVPE
jgi:hypothetical protein